MKKLMLFLGIVYFCSNVLAKALDTPYRAHAVIAKYSSRLLKIPGVSTVGIGACDTTTGVRTDFNRDWVHCVVVDVITDEASAVLIRKYPTGSTLDGVLITIEKRGRTVPEPRGSAGN